MVLSWQCSPDEKTAGYGGVAVITDYRLEKSERIFDGPRDTYSVDGFGNIFVVFVL